MTNFLGMVFGFPPQGGARHETRLQTQTKITKTIPTEIPDFSTNAHHSTSQILRTFTRFSEDFLGRERPLGRIPLGPGGSPRDPPSVSAKKVRENLEKVPRIWEVEDPGGPR